VDVRVASQCGTILRSARADYSCNGRRFFTIGPGVWQFYIGEESRWHASPLPTFLPTRIEVFYDLCVFRRSSQSRKSLKNLVMVDSHGSRSGIRDIIRLILLGLTIVYSVQPTILPTRNRHLFDLLRTYGYFADY
jgi:hypothetical protein